MFSFTRKRLIWQRQNDQRQPFLLHYKYKIFEYIPLRFQNNVKLLFLFHNTLMKSRNNRLTYNEKLLFFTRYLSVSPSRGLSFLRHSSWFLYRKWLSESQTNFAGEKFIDRFFPSLPHSNYLWCNTSSAESPFALALVLEWKRYTKLAYLDNKLKYTCIILV